MTIATSARTAGPYTGTGAVSVYPFTFKVFQGSDLLVTSTDTVGVISTLVLSSGYSVTLNADQDVSPGGTVNLASVLPIGYRLNISSAVPATQPVSLTNGGGFFPKVIEGALDRLTILLQQLGVVGVVQALRVPEIGGLPLLPAAASRAGLFLAFDSSGNPVMAAVGDGTAAALAAYIARGLAIDGSDNVVANVRIQSPRFEGTNTDDTGTPDAVFRAARTLSAGVLDGHGFRDQTTFGRTANSYASFDAAITSSGAGTNDHIAGFQARPTVSRSGGSLLHVYNFVSSPTFNSGNATNNYGLFCFNPVGGGTVDYNYGIYIPLQTKGSVANYPIYVTQQGAPSFFGSPLQVNNLFTVNPSVPFMIGALTSLDYPHLGYNYNPQTDNKAISDVAVTCKFDTGGFHVYTKAAGAPAGAGTLATMTEGLRVDIDGNVYGKAGAAAMTNGFHYMPSGAGVPGTPAVTPAGRVPFYYDTSTNKVGVYTAGVWKWTAALT